MREDEGASDDQLSGPGGAALARVSERITVSGVPADSLCAPVTVEMLVPQERAASYDSLGFPLSVKMLIPRERVQRGLGSPVAPVSVDTFVPHERVQHTGERCLFPLHGSS